MWRRNAVFVAMVLAMGLTAQAESTTPTESTLLTNQKWVRFEIVLGRITATHLRGGQGQQVREAGSESVQERLTINVGQSQTSLRYEFHGDERAVSIAVIDGSDVEIIATPSASGGGQAVRIRQQANSPLVMTIGSGRDERTYRADSVWHLLLGEEELCSTHLLPLLALMRADWQLDETAARIESELFRTAERDRSISRHDFARLIARLDGDTFASRQAADQELRQLGVSILPFLQQLDLPLLSHEQRLRIERIETYLASHAADSASRVAAWLAHDKAIWLDLLAHREPKKREAAASHLTGIHTGQIQFDPFAEETRRNEQIARLRMRIVGY